MPSISGLIIVAKSGDGVCPLEGCWEVWKGPGPEGLSSNGDHTTTGQGPTLFLGFSPYKNEGMSFSFISLGYHLMEYTKWSRKVYSRILQNSVVFGKHTEHTRPLVIKQSDSILVKVLLVACNKNSLQTDF